MKNHNDGKQCHTLRLEAIADIHAYQMTCASFCPPLVRPVLQNESDTNRWESQAVVALEGPFACRCASYVFSKLIMTYLTTSAEQVRAGAAIR